MERRTVIAAISAAIATPGDAWRNDPVVARSEGLKGEAGFDAVKDAGLTEQLIAARGFMQGEVRQYLERLTADPGFNQILNVWSLWRTLQIFEAGHKGEFAGLINAMDDMVDRDPSFVAEVEERCQAIESAIETAEDVDLYPKFREFLAHAGPIDRHAMGVLLRNWHEIRTDLQMADGGLEAAAAALSPG